MNNPTIPVLTFLTATVVAGCSCSVPDVPSDVVDKDSPGLDAVQDSIGDAYAEDILRRDIPDATGNDMMDEMCGTVTPDDIHVEGQPCEIEGESYCVEDGSYSTLLAVIGWQCIRPGYIECKKGTDNQLRWTTGNCEQDLAPLRTECGWAVDLVPCQQLEKQVACCPIAADSYGAGYGVRCNPEDVGQTKCYLGSPVQHSSVRECNYLTEASRQFPTYYSYTRASSDKCDHLYAQCPYWFISNHCENIEDCNHPEACTWVEPPDSHPYRECPGVCIHDTNQNVDRCTETCQDLYDFYDSNK